MPSAFDPYEYGKSLGLDDETIASTIGARKPIATTTTSGFDPLEYGRSLGLSDEEIYKVTKPEVQEFGIRESRMAPSVDTGERKSFTEEELRPSTLGEDVSAFSKVGLESFTSGLAGLPGAIVKGGLQLGREVINDETPGDTPFLSAGGRVLGKMGEGFEDAREKLWGARLNEKGVREATGGSFWGNEGAVLDVPEKAEVAAILGDVAGNVAGIFTGTTEAKLLSLAFKTPVKAIVAGMRSGVSSARVADTLLDGVVDLVKAPRKDLQDIVSGAKQLLTDPKSIPWSNKTKGVVEAAAEGMPESPLARAAIAADDPMSFTTAPRLDDADGVIQAPLTAEEKVALKAGVTLTGKRMDEGYYYLGEEVYKMNEEVGGTRSQLFQDINQLGKVADWDGNQKFATWLLENPGRGISASLINKHGLLGEQAYHAAYRGIREKGEVIGTANFHNFNQTKERWLSSNKVKPEDVESASAAFTDAINEAFSQAFIMAAKAEPAKASTVRLFQFEDGTLRVVGDGKQVGWMMERARELMTSQKSKNGKWGWVEQQASTKALDSKRKIEGATKNKYFVVNAGNGIGGVGAEFFTGTHANPLFSYGRGMDELGSHVGMKADQAKKLQKHQKEPSLFERRTYGFDQETTARMPLDSFWHTLIARSTAKYGDVHGAILQAGEVEAREAKYGSHGLLTETMVQKGEAGAVSSFHQKADKLLLDRLNQMAVRSNGKIESVEQLRQMIDNPPRFSPEEVQVPAAKAFEAIAAKGRQEGLDDVDALIDSLDEALGGGAAGVPPPQGAAAAPFTPIAALGSTQVMGAFTGQGTFVPIAAQTIQSLLRGQNSPAAVRFNRQNALAKMADVLSGVKNVSRQGPASVLLPISQVFREIGGVAKEFIRNLEQSRGIANQFQNRTTHNLGKVLEQVGTTEARQAEFIAIASGKVSPVAARQSGVTEGVVNSAEAFLKLKDEFTTATLKIGNRDAKLLEAQAVFLKDWRQLFDMKNTTFTGVAKDDITKVADHIKKIRKEGNAPEVYTTLNRYFADIATDEAMQMTFGYGLDHTSQILKMYSEAMKKVGKYDANGNMIPDSNAYNPATQKYFDDAADSVLNLFATSEQKKMFTFLKGVRNVETMTKLTFAGVRNATQLGITAAISGKTLETLNTVGRWMLQPSFRKGLTEYALDAGALTDSIMHDLILGADAFGSKATSKMLKVTAFNYTEMFNRVISAHIGLSVADNVAKKFYKIGSVPGAEKSVQANFLAEKLKDMGIDPSDVIANNGFLTVDDKMKSARWMVNNSQYATTPEGLPAWYVSVERGQLGEIPRTVMQFKQFSYRNLTNMYDHLWRQHIAAAKQATGYTPEMGNLEWNKMMLKAATNMVPEWFNAAPGIAAGAAATFAANTIIGLANGSIEFPQNTTMGQFTGSERDTYYDQLKAPSDEEQAINLLSGLMSMDVFVRALNQADDRKDDVPWVLKALKDWSLPVTGRTIENVANAYSNKDRGHTWLLRQELPAIRRFTDPLHQKYGTEGEGFMENPFSGAGPEIQQQDIRMPSQYQAPAAPPMESSAGPMSVPGMDLPIDMFTKPAPMNSWQDEQAEANKWK